MFDKLEVVEARYEELTKLISDPEVIANQSEWQKLIKEHSSIEEVVQKYREYKKEKQRMEDAKEITDTLLASKAVILNLNNIDIDLARRVLDFAMGTTYAINGTLQKITDSIFVIVPDGVDISGAFVDNITQ